MACSAFEMSPSASLFSLFCQNPQRQRQSQVGQTCIVNESHGDLNSICARAVAKNRACAAPVCSGHLCQHQSSGKARCRATPMRLVHGTIYPYGGLFPDRSKSVNCERHEKYNCVQLMSNSVRCSGKTVPRSPCCVAHAASLCGWKIASRTYCAALAYKGTCYCREHCWYGFSFFNGVGAPSWSAR